MFFYGLYASSFFLHQTSISCLPFTSVLFSHWYVHHVRSHSLGTDSMAKIKRKCTFMLSEHYISLWAQPALLETGVGDLNYATGCLVTGRAPSKVVDRVIKMCFEDINLFWPCAVLLGSSEGGSTLESNHCSPAARSVQGAWMTNPSAEQLAHTQTFTNTSVQSYCATLALRHMWHMLMRQALPVAGSTALSSAAAHHYRNQSHFHLHHLSSSHRWREGVTIIFSPTQSGGGLANHSPYASRSCFKKKPHKLQYGIWHPTHAVNKKSSARSQSAF